VSGDVVDVLAATLPDRPRRAVTEWSARPAAVLLPLARDQDGWGLVFTLRTETVETHRGQVSFPGGRIEPGDSDPVAAALRESQEEIGLLPTDVKVIGVLDSLLTVTQYEITPVVGVIPWPYHLTLDPVEVAEAFRVPLDWLSDPANLETRWREPMAGGPPVPVYYFRPFDGRIIWGASARITLDLLDRMALRAPPE
jgi:8-oxo-dGTP pyrophosphatase MutT (NUDIX family)